jgi:VIT1/CCC1 family predicted Fe2+/Mn2+ transporter
MRIDVTLARRAGRGSEMHLRHRSNWLRAAVLGANDGILSIASPVVGRRLGDGARLGWLATVVA